ncbi:MAG: hypothetical protein GWQ05_17385 [Verrucomicrobiaceae bacterium]|jgi:hypothetical protein|nr:hypothetical protein [Verrucomicrobiales bacterium]MDB2347175.1 hypothetical protein [Verrucomicrobiales bacterium]NCF84155.1 hypothetical protein [Verrucomicrobiaceae bacterium]NCF92706.1 hypothetical protein [Verrucomicrobiaceae bacterium]
MILIRYRKVHGIAAFLATPMVTMMTQVSHEINLAGIVAAIHESAG